MATIATRADTLNEYLTGAGSDGGTQTAPNAALGNYRSSTEALVYGITITSAIANISITFASGGNVPGAGSLQCIDANSLQWKDASGASYGPAVSVSNGASAVLEVGGAPGAYIRITRTSATALVPGTATVTLAYILDNVFALADVTSAQATSGEVTYRGTIVKNVGSGNAINYFRWIGQLGTAQVSNTTQLGSSGAGTIVTTGTFVDWPVSGFCRIQTSGGSLREIVYYTSRTNTTLTVPSAGRSMLSSTAAAGSSTDNIYSVPGIAIAIDTAGVTAAAAIQTIANETTAPTSVSWVTGITSGTGLNIGTVTPGQQVGIWIKRQVAPGATSTTNLQSLIQSQFDAA